MSGDSAATLAQEGPAPVPSWLLRSLPGALVLAFLSGTVILFAFGPWSWPVSHPLKLYGFIAAAQAALALGYLLGLRAPAVRPRRQIPVRWLLLAGSLAALALVIPISWVRTGDLLPDVVRGWMHPREAYYFIADLGSGGGWLSAELPYMVLSPLMALTLPLAVFYWGSLSTWIRALAVAAVVAQVGLSIAMGTNKGVAQAAILFSALAWAQLAARRTPRMRGRVIRVALGTVLALSFALTFFVRTQEARDPGTESLGGQVSADPQNPVVDNPLLNLLPGGVRRGVLSLSSYLTQGYYGLSLSLDEPFVPCYGAGNSMFLYRNLARLPGLESLVERPYPVRASAQGWDAYGRWSTVYPWLASDVTFPGTVVLMGPIGWLLARAWVETLDGRNAFAVGLLAQMLIVCFYIPAANEALQSGANLFAFVGILGAWLGTRGWRFGAGRASG